MKKSGLLPGITFIGVAMLCSLLPYHLLIKPMKETRGWIETPCEITQCEVVIPTEPSESKKAEFTLDLNYQYEVNRENLSASRLGLIPFSRSTVEAASLKRREIIETEHPVCFVNPDDPTQAVLSREWGWLALWFLLPVVPFSIGLSLLWEAIRQKKSPSTSKQSQGNWVVLVVGLVFLLIPLGFVYPWGIKPASISKQSQSWVETPCDIMWSRIVKESTRSKSSKKKIRRFQYRQDILYRYEFDGENFHSNRFSALIHPHREREVKEEITAQFPKGMRAVCFVNPNQPEQAVLDQEVRLNWLFLAVPVALMLMGTLILFLWLKSILRQVRRS